MTDAKTIAGEIVNRSVEGPWGLQDMADYNYLVTEKKAFTDEGFDEAVRITKDCVITDTELQRLGSLYKGGDTKALVDKLKELIGDNGANALPNRIRWLNNWSETSFLRTDYSAKARYFMTSELAFLNIVNFIKDEAKKKYLWAIISDEKVGKFKRSFNPPHSDYAEPYLVGLLEDKDYRVRVDAAAVLSYLSKDPTFKLSAVDKYISALNDSYAPVSCYAAQVLASRDMTDKAAKALPGLVNLLKINNMSVRGWEYKARVAAAEAIANIGKKNKDPILVDAIPYLIDLLNFSFIFPYDNPTETQIIAAKALGTIGPKAWKAIPKLSACLCEDLDLYLRLAAMDGLGKIMKNGKGEYATRIVSRLKDRLEILLKNDINYDARAELSQIAKTLGNIGPEAKECVPMLIETLNRFRTLSGEMGNDLPDIYLWDVDIALHNIRGE